MAWEGGKEKGEPSFQHCPQLRGHGFPELGVRREHVGVWAPVEREVLQRQQVEQSWAPLSLVTAGLQMLGSTLSRRQMAAVRPGGGWALQDQRGAERSREAPRQVNSGEGGAGGGKDKGSILFYFMHVCMHACAYL